MANPSRALSANFHIESVLEIRREWLLKLFRFLNYVLTLPEELSGQFDREWEHIGETVNMPYATSFERRAPSAPNPGSAPHVTATRSPSSRTDKLGSAPHSLTLRTHLFMSSQLLHPALEQPSPASRLFGYARVSTDDQDLSVQVDALQQHGFPKGGSSWTSYATGCSVGMSWYRRTTTVSRRGWSAAKSPSSAAPCSELRHTGSQSESMT